MHIPSPRVQTLLLAATMVGACATRDLEFGGQAIAAEQVHGSFMAALGSAYARVVSVEEFQSK